MKKQEDKTGDRGDRKLDAPTPNRERPKNKKSCNILEDVVSNRLPPTKH